MVDVLGHGRRALRDVNKKLGTVAARTRGMSGRPQGIRDQDGALTAPLVKCRLELESGVGVPCLCPAFSLQRKEIG